MDHKSITKIIVISMPDASDRRSRFEDRARGVPVAWRFYPARASLHPALRYDEQDAIVAKGRPLRAGELGCYSSHYAAWEDLQADDADQYVVLEDDVIVDWNFVGKLVAIDLARIGIDYLRLVLQGAGARRAGAGEFCRTRAVDRGIVGLRLRHPGLCDHQGGRENPAGSLPRGDQADR